MTSLTRKFKTVYRKCIKTTYKPNTIPDLSVLFSNSELQKNMKKNGNELLKESMNDTSKKLAIRLRMNQPVHTPVSTTFTSSDIESLPSSPTSPSTSSTSSTPSTLTPLATHEKLKRYVEFCKSKADKYGFDLQTEVHQVLGSKNIILLKKGQFCPELFKFVDCESLFNSIQSKALNKDIIVETNTYLELATLLRNVNEQTDRRALKIELNKVYEKSTKEDGMFVEIFVNLVTKLPNLQRLSPVGEMELTVNFLDPILPHVLHCPELNKHFIWLNRKDDNVVFASSLLINISRSGL
ncbi:hypothetical protein BD770DRAFT_335091 [Pilaira anomala]|nr:hypothetical protein BD770DRAFT_335091 [Pilaira anomala]